MAVFGGLTRGFGRKDTENNLEGLDVRSWRGFQSKFGDGVEAQRTNNCKSKGEILGFFAALRMTNEKAIALSE